VASATAIEASGDAFAYFTLGPLPGAPTGATLALANLARRAAGGWSTSSLPIPYPEAEDFLVLSGPAALSPDLSEGIWSGNLPPAAPEAPQERGLFRGTDAGQFSQLVAPVESDAFKGASTDLQHVLFTAESHLLPGDVARTEGSSVYEIDGSSVRLVDVGDDGSLLSACGSTVPPESPISRDGRRVFFMTQPSCAGPRRAYMREDALTTTLISASQCTLPDCGPEADASVVGATPSGSSAFVVTEQRLTDDDVDGTADLYRYDAADGRLTLLSAMAGTDLTVTAEPSARISDDGSTALFWAKDPSVGDGSHIYLATSGGTRLIAPSAGELAQLSTDGRYALFTTKAQLGDGDTDGSADVYRFDAGTETLRRISAGPAGGNGSPNATIATDFFSEGRSHPYRAMSDDGDVFFGTAERLVTEDRNEVADVYEWRDGSLALVSAGSGDRPSLYLGATPDGSSAFFRTTLTLLPLDRDGGELDIYVARVGGGFREAPPRATCKDESCLPPLNGRAERPLPRSAVAGVPAIRVKRPSAKARRRFVRTGRIVMLAEVPSAKRLVARAYARIGGRGRVVASVNLKAVPGGAVRLAMPLSRGARRALAAGRFLRLRVLLRLSRPRMARRIAFVLGGRR